MIGSCYRYRKKKCGCFFYLAQLCQPVYGSNCNCSLVHSLFKQICSNSAPNGRQFEQHANKTRRRGRKNVVQKAWGTSCTNLAISTILFSRLLRGVVLCLVNDMTTRMSKICTRIYNLKGLSQIIIQNDLGIRIWRC